MVKTILLLLFLLFFFLKRDYTFCNCEKKNFLGAVKSYSGKFSLPPSPTVFVSHGHGENLFADKWEPTPKNLEAVEEVKLLYK